MRRAGQAVVQQGFSLTELMIASAIGVFLISGALSLYLSHRKAEQLFELHMQLQEAALFALNEIGRDVQLAGFAGLHSDSSKLTNRIIGNIYCSSRNVTQWTIAPEHPLRHSDDHYALPCPPKQHITGNDTLTLRFAAPSVSEPEAGRIQIFTDERGGFLHNSPAPDTLTEALNLQQPQNHQLRLHAYFIGFNPGTGQPQLRRWELTGNRLRNERVMTGISGLQVQYTNRPGKGEEPAWTDTLPEQPFAARLEVTATATLRGKPVEQTVSRVFRLRNLHGGNTS